MTRCRECKFCTRHQKIGNTRSEHYCDHPNQEYILAYCEHHRISKMPGFISFGKNGKPDIKTAPVWCPLK